MSADDGGLWWPGIVGGAILIVLGVVMVLGGELDRVTAVHALNASGGAVVEVTRSEWQGLNGRLVWVQGTPVTDRPAVDRQFGVSVATPTLKRVVEMQQWKELDDGGGAVSYVRRWYDHPIDSSSFKQPERHQNPRFPFPGKVFHGGTVTLDGLALGQGIRDALPGSQLVAPDFSTMPANLAASFRLSDGVLWSSRHPRSPVIGDLRISWLETPMQSVSIVARVDNNVLHASPDLPSPGYLIVLGDVPPELMLFGRPEIPRLTWLWRILGLACAIGGIWLVWAARLRRKPDPWRTAPVAIVPIAVIAGGFWVTTSWLAMGIWWLLAIVAAAAMVWHSRYRKLV